MCGIFGAVSLSGGPLKHPGCLRAMAAALAHRGLLWPAGGRAYVFYPARPPGVNRPAAGVAAPSGRAPAPLTMLTGISKLPPALLLVADRSGVTLRRYWDPAAVAAAPSRLDRPAALRDVLLASVERELMSDVPIGVFTSGRGHAPPPPGAAAGRLGAAGAAPQTPGG